MHREISIKLFLIGAAVLIGLIPAGAGAQIMNPTSSMPMPTSSISEPVHIPDAAAIPDTESAGGNAYGDIGFTARMTHALSLMAGVFIIAAFYIFSGTAERIFWLRRAASSSPRVRK